MNAEILKIERVRFNYFVYDNSLLLEKIICSGKPLGVFLGQENNLFTFQK